MVPQTIKIVLDTELSVIDCLIDNGLVDKQQWSLTYTHFLLKKCLWAWQWCESYHAFQDMCYIWLQDIHNGCRMTSQQWQCHQFVKVLRIQLTKGKLITSFFFKVTYSSTFTWGKTKSLEIWFFISPLCQSREMDMNHSL